MLPTPVTVFNGFLGSGKTSIILQLIGQLPSTYKVVFLKNEFGDQKIDSQLAKLQNIAGVQEILNGCLCCVLVGQLKNAICELMDNYQPDRIFIETSGSAFPAPLAWQINEMERERVRSVYLDGIITVIDCVNFRGYEDTSYTARLQAQYTDLMVLNKSQLVDERQIDSVLDKVLDLNPDTPYVRANQHARVSIDLILGADRSLPPTRSAFRDINSGTGKSIGSDNVSDLIGHYERHMADEVDVLSVTVCNQPAHDTSSILPAIERLLSDSEALPRDNYYRIKGTVKTDDGDNTFVIVNWAFGRHSISQPFQPDKALNFGGLAALTVIGGRGQLTVEDETNGQSCVSANVWKLFTSRLPSAIIVDIKIVSSSMKSAPDNPVFSL